MAAEILAEQIEHRSAGRYYSDLADFQLFGARLALASGDREQALQYWHRACQMMAAYGWRKDITIYELLDPLPNLIAADRSRGQERAAMVQPLCERIPPHTDGKETRGAPPEWWHLVGLADPAGAARLAVPRLLQRCNQPNWLLHEALESLWDSWCEQADPVLSGALRLTLDQPLNAKDPEALALLTAQAESGSVAANRLATWLLARADERPTAYSFSNGDEHLARDEHLVAGLTSVAETADLPNIIGIRKELGDPAQQPEPDNNPLASIPPTTRDVKRRRPQFRRAHPGWPTRSAHGGKGPTTRTTMCGQPTDSPTPLGTAWSSWPTRVASKTPNQRCTRSPKPVNSEPEQSFYEQSRKGWTATTAPASPQWPTRLCGPGPEAAAAG